VLCVFACAAAIAGLPLLPIWPSWFTQVNVTDTFCFFFDGSVEPWYPACSPSLQVASHLEGRVWKANVHVLATCAWGLASCGHTPSAAFVEELLAASVLKLGQLEATEAVMLAQALAKFGYRPDAPANAETAVIGGGASASSSSSSSGGGSAQKRQLWRKWWERYCSMLNSRSLHPKQVGAHVEMSGQAVVFQCVW
jgi:hypothetical protein